jgi:uncharacterized protein GlcG (DUF336 family)
MKTLLTLAGLVLAAAPAAAQVNRGGAPLPLTLAIEAAQGAIAACEAQGWPVTVAVVDVNGVQRLLARADHATIHTDVTAFRKAYTVATLGPIFRFDASAALAQMVAGNPAALIKSHHNVGGLPERMKLKLLEPLRELFKDEVRAVGEACGLPREVVWRQPFPGPGLGVRVAGDINKTKLEVLRAADAILQEEMMKSGYYWKVWQSFAVYLPVKSVGVIGDERNYADVISLRIVESRDAMTADWARLPYDLLAKISSRITNEVRGVSRVLLDISSKPPATIEWE